MTDKFVYILKDYENVLENEVGIISEDKGDICKVEFMNSVIDVPKKYLSFFDINKTGDAYPKKICNRCGRLLPTENFQKNQNAKNNRTVRRPSCSECRSKIDGKKVTPKLKEKWNETKPEYVIWQCPICKKKTIPGLTSKIVLDHDHETGMPREWICDSCNTGLGRFNDDVRLLENAISYLKKHDTKNDNKK